MNLLSGSSYWLLYNGYILLLLVAYSCKFTYSKTKIYYWLINVQYAQMQAKTFITYYEFIS